MTNRGRHCRVETLRVPVGARSIRGELTLPRQPRMLVVFADAPGCDDAWARSLARTLQRHSLATFVGDLAAEHEDWMDRSTDRFRTEVLLAGRLTAVVGWLRDRDDTPPIQIGLFGHGIGGTAALVAAALQPDVVTAVATFDARPDLALSELPYVMAPTLLVTRPNRVLLDAHRDAMPEFRCKARLAFLPWPSGRHHRSRPLDRVGSLAGEWFRNEGTRSGRLNPRTQEISDVRENLLGLVQGRERKRDRPNQGDHP